LRVLTASGSLVGVVRATWDELTDGLDDPDLALLTEFREICRRLPDTEERVSRTEVAYAVRRIFASAYMKAHWLEMAVHLRRQAEHPRLRAAFSTTSTVVTHRLTIGTLDELRSVVPLVEEAHETVGQRRG
jgi:hypothetical protein